MSKTLNVEEIHEATATEVMRWTRVEYPKESNQDPDYRDVANERTAVSVKKWRPCFTNFQAMAVKKAVCERYGYKPYMRALDDLVDGDRAPLLAEICQAAIMAERSMK